MFDATAIRKRLKAVKAWKSLVGWIPLFVWLWRRVGDAYDIADTFALFELLWRGPFMSGILAFIQDWGWLIGIAWLTGLILWPSRKEDDQKKLDTKQAQVGRGCKLAIHSAFYGAPEAGGEDFDVSVAIRQKIIGDALIIDRIENHSFGGAVFEDPKVGVVKRLQVDYSYGGRKHLKVAREEHESLVLPEDPSLTKEVERVRRENLHLQAQLSQANEHVEALEQSRKEHGRWRIRACGQSSGPLNLSVAIQFIEARDAPLAEKIYSLYFSPQLLLCPWKATPVEQVKWFKNPSGSTRIVIFSARDRAEGLKATFNDCELLEGKVDRFDMGFATEQQAHSDITFVIFPGDGP